MRSLFFEASDADLVSFSFVVESDSAIGASGTEYVALDGADAIFFSFSESEVEFLTAELFAAA